MSEFRKGVFILALNGGALLRADLCLLGFSNFGALVGLGLG